MKKNLLKLLVVAMFVVVLTAALVACNGTTIQKVDFTITFEVDGETYFEIKTQGSEVLEMPTNPTKENYIFDGWYWDKDEWQRPFTASSLANEPLTDNLTVYAKWTEVELTQKIFTVSFNSMGGTAVEPVKVQYGKLLTAPERPTKLGYALVGWYKEADYSTKWDFNLDKVTEDLTLYAKWVDESDATGCDILSATGFDKEGYTYSIKVANSQEHFVLSQAITVSPYAEWTVTSDIAGKEVIPSGTVDLKVGDNTFYINVVSGTGSNKKQYTIKIRRREIYNVTYQFGNGQADETVSVEEDSKPENKTPENKQGYTFEGWLLDDELWKFDTDVVTESITLVAKWNANGYEVTLNSRDGSAVDAQQVTYDATFNFPVPTKKGYTFQGWETEEGDLLTDAQGAGLDVWKNTDDELTLYAKWQLNTYTITYHGVTDHGAIKNALANSNPAQYTVELADITLSSPTSAGYTFEKWYEDAGFQTPIETIDTARAENLDLYAKFALVTYTAKFYADGNKVGDDVMFNVETESLEEPSIPDKTGYTGEWADYTIGAQDLTINAVYTAIVYDIEYLDTKDADNPNRKTYTIEDSDITLSNITAVGYNFLGWFVGEQKVEKIESGSTGKKTFTAHWSTIQYTLQLEYDEHIFKYAEGDSNPNCFDIESNFELKGLEAYAVGYHFIGWFTEKNNGDGEQVTSIEPGRHEDLTLYAHYGLEEYTITYHNVEGIDNTNATTYTVLSEEITIHALSKNGYDFDGWFSDEDCLNEADTTIETGSHGNLNFYAKWTPIQYPLTFQLAGGEYESEENKTFYTIEDSFTFVEPKRDGYRFDGWFTLADGGDRQTEIVEGTTGNLTFYAHWTRITTLHFESKGGSTVTDMQVPAGDEISAPQAPSRDYYTFAYWCSDEACAHEFTFDKMPENDQTLYAKWTPIEYTIHYVLYGGDNNEGNPETYNVESHVTLLQPTKTGYTFNAWFKNAQFTGEMVEEIAVGSHDEITLYASFTINQYTMSFNTHEGTTIDDITQNYDTLITPPGNPAKLGYKFAGWYKDAEYQEEYTIGRMPAENLTLHAKWEIVEYDIHYNLDNGDNNELNPETYNIESNGVTLHDPSKNGYTFKGWYSDSRMETQIESIPAGSYGVKEVYAKWEAIEYDISYVVPEGTVNNNIIKYSIETDITILEEGELLGHKFEGWFRDPSYETQVTQIGGGETGELTLYGKFTPNQYTVWLGGTDEASGNVSFDLNGAEGVPPQTQHITEQDGLTYPEIPTRTGYLFGGWYANRACEGTPYDFSGNVGGDFTLYAKWIELGDGATAISIGESATVTLHGKEEQIYRFVPLVSGNISITTQGNIDTLGTLYCGGVLLRQDDDSGNDGKNFLIVYNVTAGTVYEIRVRGFSTSASGTTSLKISGTIKPVDGGKTHTGNRTTVTFGSQDFELGVPEAGDLEKFLGWEDVDGILYTDGTGKAVRAWDHDNTTVLFAKWEHMTYTVTFMTNGGSNVNETNTVRLDYGARLDINLYKTTKNNYSFTGWYLSSSDSEPYNASTMPDHDLVLYAGWRTYVLGEIKYDEEKKAISQQDNLTAELFSAICLDTNGQPASITVSIINGTQEAGETVTVRLVAASGTKIKQVTIYEVKVYGSPTLEVTNESKDYVNLSDVLNGELFGASGVDTYGEATQIRVSIDGEYEAGKVVTVVIQSVDVAGNITEQRIENIKVYGEPVIDYNEDKHGIKVEDELMPELFSASAHDSFGVDLNVTVALQSGSSLAGNTVTIRLSATDSKGNVRNIDLEIKIYGSPVIFEATTTDFKVEDDITVESLGLQAQDTYEEPLEITLTHTGTQNAGETMIYTATVTDVAGNIATKEISVRIFGTPTITYGRTDIKNTEDPRSDVMVSFDLNGAEGNPPASQMATGAGLLVYPTVPTREGYAFTGWYTTSDCTTLYDFSETISSNTTLYAGWKAMESSYMTREYIDIVSYNSSSSCKTVEVTASSSSKQNYYYFTCYAAGTYTLYATYTSGDFYITVYNATKNSTILNKTNLYSSNASKSASFTANAGDVVYVSLYKYSSSGSTAGKGTFYVSGINYPTSGGLDSNTNPLQITATDSFGQNVFFTVTLKSGSLVGGQTAVYIITATDKLGNVCVIETSPIKIYDVNDIELNYFNMASDLIKLSSHGEEFSAAATDSFGNPCTISIERSDGGTITAGHIETIVIVATDKAGNRKVSDPIANIKVFGMPEIVCHRSGTIDLTSDPSSFFQVKDSFGQELYFTAEIIGDLTVGQYVDIKITATDDANNTIEQTFSGYYVKSSDQVLVHFVHADEHEEDLLLSKSGYELPQEYLDGWEYRWTTGLKSTGDIYDGENDFEVDMITLYAEFVKEVSIDPKQGTYSGEDVILVIYGDPYTISVPTLANNQFLGWYDSETDGTQYVGRIGNSIFKTAEEGFPLVLYAQWSPIYKITYTVNGGTMPSYYAKEYVSCDGTSLPTPTKTGHSFDGWYKESSFKTRLSSIAKNTTGNIALYAKWTANTYTITIYSQYGGGLSYGRDTSYSSTMQVTYGQNFNLPVLSSSGKIFMGWKLSDATEVSTKIDNTYSAKYIKLTARADGTSVGAYNYTEGVRVVAIWQNSLPITLSSTCSGNFGRGDGATIYMGVGTYKISWTIKNASGASKGYITIGGQKYETTSGSKTITITDTDKVYILTVSGIAGIGSSTSSTFSATISKTK